LAFNIYGFPAFAENDGRRTAAHRLLKTHISFVTFSTPTFVKIGGDGLNILPA